MEEILGEIEHFYSDLYSPKEVHDGILKEVLDFLDKKIKSPNVLLTQDFTLLEIKESLKGFKKREVPRNGWTSLGVLFDFLGHFST